MSSKASDLIWARYVKVGNVCIKFYVTGNVTFRPEIWQIGTNAVEPLHTDTSLIRTVSNVPTKFSYISYKNTPIIRTLYKTDNGHYI